MIALDINVPFPFPLDFSCITVFSVHVTLWFCSLIDDVAGMIQSSIYQTFGTML